MLLAVLARIPCHRWTHGEHIPVLGIPVTWAMVVWPGIMTISRSRYAKLGFDFYRFWWLSLPTVPPRFTGCSQKLRHTEVNMCYVLNISCNCCDVWNIVNAIVMSWKMCGHTSFTSVYIHDNVAKNRNLLQLDLIILRGLYKCNLQVTLDHNWCSLAIILLLSSVVKTF